MYGQNEQEKFKVEGRLFSFGDSLHISDSSGETLASIEQKLMSFLPRYDISIGGGNDLCGDEEIKVIQTEIIDGD
ncbi:LURP-one-related family protein [Bacillus mojavensis]|uniref:LURP-one-related family protein n=1 Tax=Bacillus mojavensis TaxID=72360 RepID=UPI00398A8119